MLLEAQLPDICNFYWKALHIFNFQTATIFTYFMI